MSNKDPSDSRYKINKFTYYKKDNSICGDTSEHINGTSLPSFISVGCNKPHSIEYEMILESDSETWFKNQMKCRFSLFNKNKNSICDPKKSLSIEYSEKTGLFFDENTFLEIYTDQNCQKGFGIFINGELRTNREYLTNCLKMNTGQKQ